MVLFSSKSAPGSFGHHVAGIAPFVEETLKAVGVVLIYLIARDEMDVMMDGFVYGAMIGLGFAIGMSYYFVVGFSRALGQTGSLPPLIAAWTANGVFAVVAGYYQVSTE